MRLFARVNNAITWWKVAIPVVTIIILLFKSPPRQLHRRMASFMPGRGPWPVLGAALPAVGHHLRLLRLR